MENEFKEKLLHIVKTEKPDIVSFVIKKRHIDLYEFVENNTCFLNFKKTSFSERLYCFLNDIKELSRCHCGKDLRFKSFPMGYSDFCSTKCYASLDKTKKMYKEYWDNKSEDEKIKIIQKREETNLKRFGTECCLQNDKIKMKTSATMNRLYGARYSSQSDILKEKYIKTCQEKYGVDFFVQSSEFKGKSELSYIEKYGEKCSSHVEEILEKRVKSSFRRKEYIFPSGKKEYVQGYEPQALDILINKYKEEDIIIGCSNIKKYIGEIKYVDKNNKNRKFFPDIYIKSKNKIIEVKSTFSYDYNKEINELKKKACIDMGFDFEFMIIRYKNGR